MAKNRFLGIRSLYFTLWGGVLIDIQKKTETSRIQQYKIDQSHLATYVRKIGQLVGCENEGTCETRMLSWNHGSNHTYLVFEQFSLV